MSISIHICFTLATGCAYALYIYMYIYIYVCVDVYVCMYIHLYECMPLHLYLEGPKNPDGLNLDIHMFVYVYKVHMIIYMLRGVMRSWTNCFFSLTYFFFRKRKAKDVNANNRSSQILIPRFERIDPQSRVLNYFL